MRYRLILAVGFVLVLATESSADVSKREFQSSFPMQTFAQNTCKSLGECYAVPTATCVKLIAATGRLCIEDKPIDSKIPAIVTKTEGGKIGGMIFVCAVKQYSESFKSNFKDSKRCRAFLEDLKKHS